jgi:hypothetical protein
MFIHGDGEYISSRKRETRWHNMTFIEIVVVGKGATLMEIDDRNPRTAQEICGRLPLEARAQTWQEEVYFGLSFKLADEKPSPNSEVGDVSYWTTGIGLQHIFLVVAALLDDEKIPV